MYFLLDFLQEYDSVMKLNIFIIIIQPLPKPGMFSASSLKILRAFELKKEGEFGVCVRWGEFLLPFTEILKI